MENRSLVQIVNQVASLESLLIDAGGEITPEIESALVVKDTHLPEKIDNYSIIVERSEMLETYYRSQAQFFARIADAFANTQDRLKENLKSAMKQMNVNELCGNDYKYKLSPTNPSAIIDDESAIDKAYTVTKTTTSIDKKKILEDLKLGVPVKGARMQENFRLTKSANRGK